MGRSDSNDRWIPGNRGPSFQFPLERDQLIFSQGVESIERFVKQSVFPFTRIRLAANCNSNVPGNVILSFSRIEFRE